MGMIRNNAAATMGREAVVLNLGDLAAQAEMMRARARAEADQIIAAAKSERDRLLSDAAEVGRAEGLAEGREEGRKDGVASGREEALTETRSQLQKLEGAWMASLAKFDAERDTMLIDARQDVVRLAALMGEFVTKRALALEPSRVVDQVSSTLSLLVKPTRLTLVIHPDDAAMVRDALPALCAKYTAATHVDLAEDPQVGRGSCVLKTASGGEIDASNKTQLQRIVESLLPDQVADPEPAGGEAA